MILTSVLQAIGLFAATNIDDIIVLSLFFARGAGQRGTTARILAGQYLGFAGILVAAILVTTGAGAFLPPAAIPYFGLIPLGLGLWAVWEAWRGDGDDDDEAKVAGKKVGVGAVAGVTFANGGDNIGVYTPVFLSVEPLAESPTALSSSRSLRSWWPWQGSSQPAPRSRKCSNALSTSSFPSFSSASVS